MKKSTGEEAIMNPENEITTDREKIKIIVDGSIKVLKSVANVTDVQRYANDLALSMDVAHNGNTPLRLDDMVRVVQENANDTATMELFSVVHDVIGIHNHINRDTFKVEKFVPRFIRHDS